MNRILTTIIALWSMCTMAGLPPTTLSGEQSATKPTTFTFETPNYQGTQTSGIKSRVETGNTNLLVNPSFEHSTVTTGWTITNATATADTTNQVEGKKALSLALTGALSVVQDSTINAANLVGLQGVARIKIKTSDVDGLKVCARNAGVTSTSLCINIPKDGVWKEINIPYILTATSNGIAITSTGTTGTVKIDDAFVGTSAPFQGVSGAKLVDVVTISGCATGHNTTSTTFATLGTQTGCTYTSAKGICGAPSTNIMGVKCSALAAGDYRIEYEGGLGTNSSSTSTTAFFQFWDGTNTAREYSNYYAYSSQIISSSLSQTISYSTAQSNLTLELRAKISGTAAAVATGTASQPAVIKVWYFPPESKIYSQASQDVAYQPCTFSTLAWQGFGTVTNNLLCARKGQDLLIKGKWTAGTTAASLGQIPLPTNFGSLTIASNISSNQVLGSAWRNSGSAAIYYNLLASPSTSYISVSNSLINGTNSPVTPVNGSSIVNSSEVQDIPEVKIPIQGWQDYGVIVGSFAGIETCSSPYECTDTFSAYISSTGVVSNENIDWINGNCTNPSTGNYTCTFNTTLKDGVSALSSSMLCNVTTTAATSRTPFGHISANSTTAVSPQIVDDNGATTNSGFFISCQKGANDYKPKTAKVASSIGVPTVPNAGTNAIDTFSFSFGTGNITTACTASPCSFLDQIGGAVSSVTRITTGTYTVNLNKTYSKLKCTAIGSVPNGTASSSTSGTRCESCNVFTFDTINTSGALADRALTLYCQGSY